MKERIDLFTDASLRDGDGFAIAASITYFTTEGERKTISFSSYYDKEIKSTKAEYIAIVFGIEKAYKECPSPDKRRLVVNSDCQYAVNKLRDSGKECKDNWDRIARNYMDCFNSFATYHVDRGINGHADSIARSTLDKNNE